MTRDLQLTYDDAAVCQYANKLAEAWRDSHFWPLNLGGINPDECEQLLGMVWEYFCICDAKSFEFSPGLHQLMKRPAEPDVITELILRHQNIVKRKMEAKVSKAVPTESAPGPKSGEKIAL